MLSSIPTIILHKKDPAALINSWFDLSMQGLTISAMTQPTWSWSPFAAWRSSTLMSSLTRLRGVSDRACHVSGSLPDHIRGLDHLLGASSQRAAFPTLNAPKISVYFGMHLTIVSGRKRLQSLIRLAFDCLDFGIPSWRGTRRVI